MWVGRKSCLLADVWPFPAGGLVMLFPKKRSENCWFSFSNPVSFWGKKLSKFFWISKKYFLSIFFFKFFQIKKTNLIFWIDWMCLIFHYGCYHNDSVIYRRFELGTVAVSMSSTRRDGVLGKVQQTGWGMTGGVLGKTWLPADQLVPRMTQASVEITGSC